MKKKRYFNIVFLMLVIAAVVLFSEKGIQVMKNITQKKVSDKPIVVLDAGHPATSLGTENKTRPCVSMGDAL